MLNCNYFYLFINKIIIIKFRTGALCYQHEMIGNKIINGKNFKFLLEKHKYKNYANKDFELVIESIDEQKAQRAYELFISAFTLIQSHAIFNLNNLPSVLSYSLFELEPDFILFRKEINQFSMSGIYNAALIASKASFRKIHTISLYKYLFACSQHSIIE